MSALAGLSSSDVLRDLFTMPSRQWNSFQSTHWCLSLWDKLRDEHFRDVALTYAAYALIPLIAAEVAPWLMLPLALTGVGEGVAGLAVLGAAAGLAGGLNAALNVENGEKWYQGLGPQLVATVGELWARAGTVPQEAAAAGEKSDPLLEGFAARARVEAAKLPETWMTPRRGNLAMAAYDIDGSGGYLITYSKMRQVQPYAGAGYVPLRAPDERIFETVVVGRHNRYIDSEAKLLEEIAHRVGNNPNARGTVWLFSELSPCRGCLGVMDQFRLRYPNVALRVLTGPE